MSKTIIDYFESTPADEPCSQSLDQDFYQKNRDECIRFRDLLLKAYPPPPHAYLVIKSEPHDFGTYRNVVSMMEDSISEEDEKIVYEWNTKVSSCPSTWDELEALAQGIPVETYLDNKVKDLLH
jgi:hypothetical protein